MKKKLGLKIFFSIALLMGIVMFSWVSVDYIKSSINYFDIYEFHGAQIWQNEGIKFLITGILSILCALFALMFFILYNFKDISYLCGSLFKEMKEHKEATKEERKQKKIEELEKQLNELKKDE